METSMRYLATLSVLPRAPAGVRAAEIQGRLADLGYHVDLRTVQRDLLRMSRGFPIVATDEKAPRWSWERKAPPLGLGGLDPPLALAIVLAGTHFRAVMPSGLRRALDPLMASARKALDGHGDGGVASFERRFRVLPHGPPVEAPDFDAAVLESVTRALMTRRRLRIVRRLARRKTREEVVAPLGLVASGATLFLVVRGDDGRAPRALPLHRLRASAVLDEAADVGDFDLDAFLAAGGPGTAWRGASVALVARFRGAAAEAIQETPFAGGTIEALDEDEVRVRATVEDSAELRAWLFGFGPDVVVEAPAEIAAEMAERARAMVARYRGRD
jgi:predicted DNA-binding transcriptional regulator YafY